MYAIEFQARVKDGSIEIPSRYRDRLGRTVRVIILREHSSRAQGEGKSPNLIDQLLETPLKLKGFTPLSRDEIHARG